MSEIIFIVILLAIVWFWSNSLQAREIALTAVSNYCRKMNLQLLDDYVALTGLWPKRDDTGKIKAWRSYVFEFSVSGAERYNGKIVLLGSKVEGIYLEPHRDPNQFDS